jgi:hypothetical protein
MPSSYTPLLKFELPLQGELSGTWGNVVNTAITTPVSEAIAGTTAITVGGTDYTLTNGDGSTSNEARRMFITATGSPGAARNVICPASSKLYVFTNSTSGGFAMTLKTSAGSGVAVPAGQSRLLYCNGTDVVEAITGFSSISLTTALAATSGGTGQSSYAVGDLLYASSTTAISKLTVGATNAVLTVAAGIPSWVTTLPVASGGTGAATLAANNVLLGNGTAAVQTVAPGTAGNLLTSNGTTWTSSPAPAGGVTSLNSQTGAVTTTGLGDIGSVAVLMIAANTNVGFGATVAGSDLRYDWTPNLGGIISGGSLDFGTNRGNSTATYNGGGTALSGVWRKISRGDTYLTGGGSYVVTNCSGPAFLGYVSYAKIWAAALYVRVS